MKYIYIICFITPFPSIDGSLFHNITHPVASNASQALLYSDMPANI